MEHEPTVIEELDVAPALVRPGASRRALVTIAALAAVVGYGFIGASTEPAPASNPAVQASEAPSTRGFPPATARSMIDVPVEAATIRGSVVPVSGTVPAGVDRVRVVALVGRVVVAEGVVRPVEGRFDVRLVVSHPGDGRRVPVVLVVDDADRPSDELARRMVALLHSSPIAVTRASLTGGRGLLRLDGLVAPGVTTAVVNSEGRTAPVIIDGDRWHVALVLPASAQRASVVVRWSRADGSGGSTWFSVEPRRQTGRAGRP
jgi:hypothetical protein